MANQKDQFGAPTPTNADRSSQYPSIATPDTSYAGVSTADDSVSDDISSYKSTGSPYAQSGSTTYGSERQGEGQQTNGQAGNLLDTAVQSGKTAVQSGKKWVEESGVLNSVNQLPQSLKDLGNRAVARVSELSTTEKIVGGALLAVGLGYLATRKGKSSGSSRPEQDRHSSGSYGRRSYGYQAPDATTTRRPAASRADSGAPYGNSSRYGSGNHDKSSTIYSGSGRADSNAGFGTSAPNDYNPRASESSHRTKNDDFRSIE